MPTWTIAIPDYSPPLLNSLTGHPLKAHRLKREAAELVAGYAAKAGVPKATCRRRVRVKVVARWRRFPDPDAIHKGIHDALVRAGMLVDDSAAWCEMTVPEYERGERRETTITLEDLDR